MKHSRIVTILWGIALLVALAAPAGAALIPHLKWIQTYDSPNNGDDRGRGVALDAMGNVYVTGYENRSDLGQSDNIWLRKYDTDGNALWTKTHNSPDNDIDIGAGIALDQDGSVYVAGYETRTGQSHNIWLRKYDPTNGDTVWTDTYNNPDNGKDVGRGVAVDGDDNVYVTGYSADDTWLQKYDTNGNPLWAGPVTYGGGHGYAVDVDAAGNVYVTSDSTWLRKHDTNGNDLWTETFSGGRGYGVAVDTAGDVYVAGSDAGIWLRKYDTDKNLLWTKSYDGPASDSDGYGVAVDDAGNVYVCGREYRGDLGESWNLWLRKYDTNGNTLWTETYNSPDNNGEEGFGVAVDAAGNVYVTGYEQRDDLGESYNILLLKYEQVPEPSTLLLLAPALLGFAGVALKRRK